MSSYNKEVKYHVWTNGDRTVGDYGSSAMVTVFVCDKDHDSLIRESLKEAFQAIWDNRYVSIVTDEEIDASEAAEEAEENEYDDTFSLQAD